MSVPPWMLVRLALETRAHHHRADEDRLAAMDVTSVAEYRSFLLRIYGFEAPLEEALTRVPDLEPVIVHGRYKADALRHDLVALGLSVAQLTSSPIARPDIRSVPEALGWLFVVERQTLVSGLVRRHIFHMLGEATPASYLSVYSDAPGARFRSFGEILGQFAKRYPPSTIIAAANHAFRAQRQWYAARTLEIPAEDRATTSVA
jgi:heme oxygenase